MEDELQRSRLMPFEPRYARCSEIIRWYRPAESVSYEMSENLSVTIILSVITCVLGWAVWVIAVNIRRSRWSKQVAELHSKLLDRFTGSQELISFLEGDAGRKYFEALAFDLKDSLSRILNGIQLGVVLVLLGASLLVVRSGQDDSYARNSLLLLGVPSIALGIGFLTSAVISHRLCKAWGLLNNNGRQAS
jgi:hypothetical protein